jgi:hypothetical protein
LAFTQVSNVFLTATKSGASSGISANMHSDLQPPQQVKQVLLTFPRDTKFRLGTVPACTLTNKQIKSGKKCPSKSLIGTGSAVANVIGNDLPASVKAYAAGAKTMVLEVHASAPPAPQPFTAAIRPTVSGRQLTIPVPKLSFGGFPIYLKQLKLSVPKRGTGRHALITAGECINHKFTVKSAFTYYTGSPVTTSSSSGCTG